MMYTQKLLLFLITLSSSLAKEDMLEKSSVTYREIPAAFKNGVGKFFDDMSQSFQENGLQKKKDNLRSEAHPNEVLPVGKKYVEIIPQNPVANAYLEKEIYIHNPSCQIKFEKYEKPAIYVSHLWGVNTCYLSTFTSDINDPSTFVYAKASYEDVMDAIDGKSFSVSVHLYKDSKCTVEAKGDGFDAFHDSLPKDCSQLAGGSSEVSRSYTEPPARNLKILKGTSVSLFASIDDCVAGEGALQERLTREDNCYNGVSFECYHADRFEEYTYQMKKWPNADCTETKAREEDESKIVTTKFSRAEGCQQFMPLDATYGHPVINCGQHW